MKVADVVPQVVGPTLSALAVVLAAIIALGRPKPKPVAAAEAAKLEADAELTTAKGYQQLVTDLRTELDRHEAKVAELETRIKDLKREGHNHRNQIQGLIKLADAWFRYTDELERLLTCAGIELPRRPAILAHQPVDQS